MTPFPAYWMQIVQKWALRSSSEGQQSRLPTLSFLGAWILYAHFVHPIPMLLIPIPRLFIPIPGFPILFIFILNVFYLLRWNKVSPSKLSKTIFRIPISDIVGQARLPGESLNLGSFNEYFLSLCSSFRILCGSGAVNEATMNVFLAAYSDFDIYHSPQMIRPWFRGLRRRSRYWVLLDRWILWGWVISSLIIHWANIH